MTTPVPERIQAGVTPSLSSNKSRLFSTETSSQTGPALLNAATSLATLPPYHDTTREPTSDAGRYAAYETNPPLFFLLELSVKYSATATQTTQEESEACPIRSSNPSRTLSECSLLVINKTLLNENKYSPGTLTIKTL